MRTPEEWVAVVVLACAVSGARDVRHVYEAGAEPEPAWSPAALAWDAAPSSAWDDAPPVAYEPNTLGIARIAVAAPSRAAYYRVRIGGGRARIAQGLLTFGDQPPDPRLRGAVLVVRQLPVDAFLNGGAPPPPPPPQRRAGPAGLPPGLLTFGPAPPPPRWRSPPALQLPVRPRLAAGGAETLAVGSSPLVARLHGPVAMGSGGVGYARLPDGRLAIGSGSIGFAQFDVLSLVDRV